MGLILMIVVVVLLIATLHTWRHSRQWGAIPSGGLGLVLLVIVGLLLLGVIPHGCSDSNTHGGGHIGNGSNMGGGTHSTIP